MAFRNVVITQHSKISYKMNHCVVKSDEGITQIPIDDIQLLIISTTQSVITTHAVMEFLKHQIRIIFTDNKAFPIGEINNYYGTTNRNRNIEKQINWSKELKDKLWQQIVKTKIENSANILSEDSQDVYQLSNQVKNGDSTNREAVAARMYFPRLLGKDFTRNNRENPKNVQLNYGYQILLSTIAREISVNGYLTEIGIHHDNYDNEYNLASDLMEPFRFLIDRKVADMDEEFLQSNKIDLIKTLNDEIFYNSQSMTVNSAIATYVRECITYLNNEKEKIEIEIEI